MRQVRLLCHKGDVTKVWIEVSLHVPHALSEVVGAFLMDNGSAGLQTEEHADRTQLTAYFEAAPPIDSLQRFCASVGCALGDGDVLMRRVAEENWAENWKLHFQPHPVGERLWLCPSWDAHAPPDRIAIVIDPGMAFGTGQHATTRGCLILLERVVLTASVGRALDLGTGSGVLAIAMAKLGVPEVWAIDNDPNACAVAVANSRFNTVDARVHVGTDLAEVPRSVDLIVANLFTNLLEELAPQLAGIIRDGGSVICSGFLGEDEHRVHAAFHACGFEVADRYEEGSWITLAIHRGVQ